MLKKLALLFTLLLLSICVCAQDTYKVGKTTYYKNQTYKSGQPKVKRSSKNRSDFLKSKGYTKTPKGYEVDHIKPLSKRGTDSPSNMQLITKERKTK